jgi:hypothetical protein
MCKVIKQCVRKVAVHLGYVTYIWLSLSKLPLKCAVVSLYSVVKQRLKCNTSKVRNCLIQFLLYRRSWTSFPTTFKSAQRLSECTVHDCIDWRVFPNIYRILNWKPTTNTAHEISRKGSENMTEILNKTSARYRLVSSGSGYGPSECCCEHGSHISVANTLSLWS